MLFENLGFGIGVYVFRLCLAGFGSVEGWGAFRGIWGQGITEGGNERNQGRESDLIAVREQRTPGQSPHGLESGRKLPY